MEIWLFIIVTHLEQTGRKVWHLFVILHLYIYESPTKYLRETFLHPQSTHKKKFLTLKIPTRKNLGPTKSSFIFFIFTWLNLNYCILHFVINVYIYIYMQSCICALPCITTMALLQLLWDLSILCVAYIEIDR